jgi:hypothetical protein
VTSQAGTAQAVAAQAVAAQPGIALRRALELQVAALVPIAADLHAAAAHPAVAPADWHGPASDAYDGLEARLRARVAAADRAVATVLQTSRVALAALGG